MADELRVIMVDDEEPARRLLREYLEDTPGVSIVAECGNGFEAVKAVADHDPDLMLLDIQMPGLSGMELQQRLSGLGCGIPIVFLTAKGGGEALAEGFESGAIMYINKPFTANKFLTIVNTMLEPPAAP